MQVQVLQDFCWFFFFERPFANHIYIQGELVTWNEVKKIKKLISIHSQVKTIQKTF